MKNWLPIALFSALVFVLWRVGQKSTGTTYNFGDISASPAIAAVLDGVATLGGTSGDAAYGTADSAEAKAAATPSQAKKPTAAMGYGGRASLSLLDP